MSSLASLRRRLAARLSGEGGFALPTVLILTVIGMGFGAVVVLASVQTQSGGTRDDLSKTAFATAEAGVQQALLRYDKNPTLAGTPCLIEAAAGQIVQATTLASPAGWCAPVSGTVGSGRFTYQVKPTVGTNNRLIALEVVSKSAVSGVIRVVDVTAHNNPFRDATVVGLDSITMAANTHVWGNAATNGSITMAANTDLCGGQVGPTGTFTGVLGGVAPCDQPKGVPQYTRGTVTAPNVLMPSTITPMAACVGCGTWNASSRTLTLGNNDIRTLAAGNYSLCQLTINHGTLVLAQGVQIFFDTPENCGQPDGTTQFYMTSNGTITMLANPARVSIYFLGSTGTGSNFRHTALDINSNNDLNPPTINQTCASEFVIYGPRTDLGFNSNTTMCGAVLGKTLAFSSNFSLYPDTLADDFGIGTFDQDRFVECSTATGALPNSGCQ